TGAHAFHLAGERETVEVARTLLGRPTPCVGRDGELARLLTIYDECVSDPAARAVLLSAPAGVGKSRVRQELMARLREREAPPELWFGRGDPMSAGSPFGMLAQVVRRAAGLLDGEPAPLKQRKLRARVA